MHPLHHFTYFSFTLLHTLQTDTSCPFVIKGASGLMHTKPALLKQAVSAMTSVVSIQQACGHDITEGRTGDGAQLQAMLQ